MKTVLKTEVVLIEPIGSESGPTMYDALARLTQLGNPCILANFKRAGIPLPDGLRADDDLYAHAPEEIRREHSMHLVTLETGEKWLELVEELRARDALCMVFSTCEPAELLSKLKLYLAWFAEPRILSMQLRQGSRELAKGVMESLEAILVTAPGPADWSVYLRSDVDIEIAPVAAAT